MNCIKFYNLGNWFWKRNIKSLSRICEYCIFFLYNSYVPSSCSIGKGSLFAYKGIGCVIHKNTIIGINCVIGQNITIGGNFNSGGVPKIGDNVFIGPGSRILGNIIIGDNVIIGANSVVINSVPSNKIIAGVPAKIIKHISGQ